MRQERDIPEYVFEHLDTLKSEALKHGYTLKALSEQSGLARATLSGVTNGNLPPTRYNYNKLAEFFGWEVWQ